MKRKIISTMLVAVMVLSMTFHVSASSTSEKVLSKDQKIKILTQRGCPLSSISNAPDYLLDELLKDKGEFVKVTVQSCNFDKDSGRLKVVDQKELTDDTVTTQAVMPTSDFELSVYVERIYEKSGDNFKFTAYGNWNTAPYWCLTDVAALGWSDSFTLYYDSCTSYGIDGQWDSFTPVCSRSNVNVEAGVSHEIPLADAMISQSYTQVAKVYKSNESGSANVAADYAHKMVGLGSIQAGFNASSEGVQIGFSVSPTLSWDKAIPVYDSFDY